jgi:hypothetical protein
MTTPHKPIAWLIRESGARTGGSPRVMAGKMYVTREAAIVAAARMSSRFWKREAFPVFEPTADQLEGWR